MKTMKAVVLVLMAILVLGPLSVTKVQAAATWCNSATITTAGPGSGVVYIRITDSTSTPPVNNIWFIADAAQQNAMLATALTAMSMGVKVRVYLSNTTAYSTVLQILLIQ